MRTLYYVVAGGKHFGFHVGQGTLVLAKDGAAFDSLTETLAWAAAHEFDRVARCEPEQSQLVTDAPRGKERQRWSSH